METITLQYSKAVKEKLMKFLETFPNQELKIIEEKDERFEAVKAELHADYAAYLNGETELMDLDQFEEELNIHFPDHEN